MPPLTAHKKKYEMDFRPFALNLTRKKIEKSTEKHLPNRDQYGIISKQNSLCPHGQAVKTPPSHGGN